MVLVFELTWRSMSHAAGNRALLHVIRTAFPSEPIVFHADPSHLDAVFDTDPAVLSGIERRPISLDPRFRGRPHMVSWRRMRSEFVTLRAAFRRAGDKVTQVVFTSTPSTGIVAARAAARLQLRGDVLLQVGLHGELNAVKGWRSRNPLLRMFDYHAVLAHQYLFPTRYLVLEENIRRVLGETLPAVLPAVDVLPHPMPIPVPTVAHRTPAPPLRVGLVGQALADKGIEVFLEAARRMKSRMGNRMEFHHIGRIPAGADLARFQILDSTPTSDFLSYETYHQHILGMDYIFLPLQQRYYDLSASGALIDAIARLKPVIISDVPLSRQYFDVYGDIGYIFNSTDAIEDVLMTAMTSLTDGDYARKLDNLARARRAQGPEASAERYRQLVSPYLTVTDGAASNDNAAR